MNILTDTKTGEVVTASAGTQVEMNRAAQEIQALFMIANARPRDEHKCVERMLSLCSDPDVVEGNIYLYARGKTQIQGLGIRVIEQLGLTWGRIKWGFKVMNMTDQHAEVLCYAFDYQELVPVERTVWVANEYKADGSMKHLTDERDIREHIANVANRQVRVCIETLLGKHNIKKCLKQAISTLAFADKREEAQEQIVKGFYSRFGVTREMLEKYLEKPLAQITADDYATLKMVYAALKDGEAKPDDYFDLSLVVDATVAPPPADKPVDKPPEKPLTKPADKAPGRKTPPKHVPAKPAHTDTAMAPQATAPAATTAPDSIPSTAAALPASAPAANEPPAAIPPAANELVQTSLEWDFGNG